MARNRKTRVEMIAFRQAQLDKLIAQEEGSYRDERGSQVSAQASAQDPDPAQGGRYHPERERCSLLDRGQDPRNREAARDPARNPGERGALCRLASLRYRALGSADRRRRAGRGGRVSRRSDRAPERAGADRGGGL